MQVHSYGKGLQALLTAGVQSSKGDTPLGQKFEDGMRTFRWAYIAMASALPGNVFKKHSYVSTASTKVLSGPGGHFNSAIDGWGGRIGDTNVRLYGVSGGLTSNTRYEDGTLEIVSGTGAGFSYPVNSYEVGGTGVSNVKIKQGLIIALDTTSYAVLRPNPYYGLDFASTVSGKGRILPGGAATVSVTASGYCLVQTKGPGIGESNAKLSAGAPVMPVGSGLMSTTTNSKTALAFPWGHAVRGTAGGGDWFAVDWCME